MERPVRHSWQQIRTVSKQRALFRCRRCGVSVETCAPWPMTGEAEYWDRVLFSKHAVRPRCAEVSRD